MHNKISNNYICDLCATKYRKKRTHCLFAGRSQVQREYPRTREQHFHQREIRGRYANVERHELCPRIRCAAGFAGNWARTRSAKTTSPRRDPRVAGCRLGMASMVSNVIVKMRQEDVVIISRQQSRQRRSEKACVEGRKLNRECRMFAAPANPDAEMRSTTSNTSSSLSRNVRPRRRERKSAICLARLACNSCRHREDVGPPLADRFAARKVDFRCLRSGIRCKTLTSPCRKIRERKEKVVESKSSGRWTSFDSAARAKPESGRDETNERTSSSDLRRPTHERQKRERARPTQAQQAGLAGTCLHRDRLDEFVCAAEES